MAIWIEKNKHKNLTITTIASKVGYSQWYMQRFFKERTKMTISAYCRLRKLSESALYLRTTNASIKEISSTFGFDSPSTFATAFRRQFGITPSAFRSLNEWPFHNMMPRLDLIHEVDNMKCSLVKEHKWKIITYTKNINDLAYLVNNGKDQAFYINFEKDNFLQHSTRSIPINFSLCTSEKDSDEEIEWLSISLSKPLSELGEINLSIYTGLLPAYGVIRRGGPDCIKVNKDDNDELIITEYNIPLFKTTYAEGQREQMKNQHHSSNKKLTHQSLIS